MKRFGIEINETAEHYIVLFGYYGLWGLAMFLCVRFAEHSDWFAEIWASKSNRFILIYLVPPIFFLFLVQLHSYFFGKKKLIRTFKNKELQKLADCKDNETLRFQGELIPIAPCQAAPLSQRNCAAYTLRTSVEVERASAASGDQARTETAWETLKYEELIDDFLIQCGQHYALVRTKNAEVIIHPDRVHDKSTYEFKKSGVISDNEVEIRKRVLGSQGINSRNYLGVYAANIKFAEGVLEPHEQVAVVGSGKWIDISDMEELKFLKDMGHSEVFEVVTTNDVKLYISDSPELLAINR